MNDKPINELATALAKAQSEIKHAEKSAENPAFKRDGKVLKYATLADVWDACREPLTKNGLSIVQLPVRTEGGVSVTTILMHCSGQSIDSTLEVPAGNTAQAFGSAITYARRYTLAAIVGIAPDEDDDGAQATESTRNRQNYDRREPRQAQSNGREPVAPSERETITAKPTNGVTNVDELRARAEKLSTKLKGYMRISLAAMRDQARVSKSGSLSAEELVMFVRWCDVTLRRYEDPEPPSDFDGQDVPEWMMTPEESAS